jgi:hypothetical protein
MRSASRACMQAGVALGLTRMVAVRFPHWGPDFQTLAAAVIVGNLCVGPPLFRAAINAAGEARAEGFSKSAAVSPMAANSGRNACDGSLARDGSLTRDSSIHRDASFGREARLPPPV